VGGDDGVRLSRDGGNTWRNTGNDTPGLAQVESLAFDPADPRVLYAGTWRQAFRTRDGGETWARIAEGMVLDASVYSWDFAFGGPARHLGLDLRLGLPDARRRGQMDAVQERLH
jgi:photosystem II stability/assembly factor-like uncharacterized protein